jgi:hypothetical protein
MAPTILYAALLPLALAQSSVLTLRYAGFGEAQSMNASLIGVESSKTTLSLGCSDPDNEECAPLRQTMVLAESSYSLDGSDANTDFTYTANCVFSPQSAVCVESAGGSEANFPGESTTTYGSDETASLILTVAGDVAKLSAQATESGSASMATSTGAAQTGSKSESMASVTQISGTASPSASASKSVSGSASGSASAAPSQTAAAAARVVSLGGGLFAAVAGLMGGLFL